MTSAKRLQTSRQWKDLLDSVDNVLFDCNGRVGRNSEELSYAMFAFPIVQEFFG